MVFGLALVLALVLGVASMAFGANGDFFKVGRANVASAVSVLTKKGDGPALSLKVDRGAPLAVNRPAKVANLNADKLDGLSSSAFETANTGKIHRINSATRLDGGEISLLRVGPFKFVGRCRTNSTRSSIETRIRIAAEGRPSSGAVMNSTSSGGFTWADEFVAAGVVMQASGINASDTATGYVYSPGDNPGTVEKGVTYHLYHNRSTHPTLGEQCNFGGYVVEDA